VLVSPRFIFEAVAAGLDSLLALGTIAGEVAGHSKWGPPLLVALLVLAAYRRWRGHHFSPRLWPVLASAATFWLLAAANFIPGREAYSSRYVYVSVAFVLLVGADLLRGLRLGRRALLLAGAAAAAIAVVNLAPLREGRDFFRAETALARADLAALEIARRTIDPAFALTPEVAGTSFLVEVRADKYLTAVSEYGSPAYTPAELASAAEPGRRQADVVLANALPVTTETLTAPGVGADRRAGCVPIRSRPGGGRPLPLRPGLTRVEVAPGDAATIRLRRFARRGYPLVTEGVPGGSTTLLRIPADGAARPWRLQVEAAQRAAVCR